MSLYIPKKLCNTSKILDYEAKNCPKVRKIVEISKKCKEKKENQGYTGNIYY